MVGVQLAVMVTVDVGFAIGRMFAAAVQPLLTASVPGKTLVWGLPPLIVYVKAKFVSAGNGVVGVLVLELLVVRFCCWALLTSLISKFKLTKFGLIVCRMIQEQRMSKSPHSASSIRLLPSCLPDIASVDMY